MAVPLGKLTVSEAQDEELEELLAELTGLSPRKIRTTLDAARGNTLLRNALADSWPSTPERLAVLRASWLRELDLSQELSNCTGLSTQAIERRLQQVRGNTLGKTVFPELLGSQRHSQGQQDEPPAPPERLRVIDVRDDEEAWKIIASETGLSVRTVRTRLQEENGRRLLDNVFSVSEQPRPSNKQPPPQDEATAPQDSALVASRWRLGRKLGAGGFGEVYEATDLKHTGLKVVLKFAASAGSAAQMSEEIRSAFNLSHCNICTYIDMGEDPVRGPFLVIKQAGEESLRERILRQGAMHLDDCLEIASQIAAGLDYAHEEGVIHGDIKPDNVALRTRPSKTTEAKILDFGIAKQGRTTVDEHGRQTIQSTAAIGQSPGYAPPEVHIRHKLRKSSDQYSLALVIQSMLLGKIFLHPPEFEPFKSLSSRQNEALKRACSMDPDARFESCSAFLRALGWNR